MRMMIPILMLFIMAEVTWTSGSSVTFENPDPCALVGSSVEFGCYQETLMNSKWYKVVFINGSWKRMPLLDLPSYRNRTEYLGDQQQNCSLAIHDLQGNDTGYYFYGRHSKDSVCLSITELKVTVSPERVRAGDQVTLGCGESCELPDTVWFRDGHPVAEPKFMAQAEDSGNYVCAVKVKESVQSDSVALDVQHPPLNVSIIVSPPGHLEEGCRVNLTCISVSNPAAYSYTWYKKTDDPSTVLQVGAGQVLSLPCNSGLYICQARNSVGESNSTEVLPPPSQTDITVSNIIRICIGAVVLLLLLMIIIFDWRRRRRRYNKSAVDKEEEHSHDYENMRPTYSGKNSNKEKTQTVTFQEESCFNDDYENV